MTTGQNVHDTKIWSLWFQPSAQVMLAYGKKCAECSTDQETNQYQKEDDIDIVNMKIH